MPTPPKPVLVLEKEQKSHRTKKELAARRKIEESLISGVKIKEDPAVKQDPVAHKEFLRLKKLLDAIKKSDDLYAPSINRYCILKSESEQFEFLRTKCEEQIDELMDKKGEMNYPEYISALDKLQKNLVNLDKQIQAKRRMMFDIERENVMTIASSLRSIPKKATPKKNPLQEALSGDKTKQSL